MADRAVPVRPVRTRLRQVGEDYEDYPREEVSYRGGRSYTGSSYAGNSGRSYGGVPGGYYSYHSEKEHQIKTLESMMDKMKTEPERQVIRDSIECLRMLGQALRREGSFGFSLFSLRKGGENSK